MLKRYNRVQLDGMKGKRMGEWRRRDTPTAVVDTPRAVGDESDKAGVSLSLSDLLFVALFVAVFAVRHTATRQWRQKKREAPVRQNPETTEKPRPEEVTLSQVTKRKAEETDATGGYQGEGWLGSSIPL